jgi:hypothetical protein
MKILIYMTIIYSITQYKHSDSLIFRKTVVTNIKKYKVYSMYVRLASRNEGMVYGIFFW